MVNPLKKLFLVIVLSKISLYQVVSQVAAEKKSDQGYHVIVGVFKVQGNAERYSENLIKKGMDVSYSFNSEKNMYYVSAGNFPQLNTAIEEVTRIRKDSAFYDAWIKAIGDGLPLRDSLKQNDQPLALTSELPIENLPANEEGKIIQHDQITLENTEVFLSLFNATNNRVIEGKVKIIDGKKNKLIAEVDGNKYLMLPSSSKGPEKLILICEITGYRKIQMEINYANPLQEKGNPSIELFGTTVFVNFEMVPYAKGDIVTLYNVYFYNDAAIMQPESQFELNQVVQMMKDNPEQHIRLHGHTNGNYTGQIISMGPDKNYFSLQGTQKDIGTARQLAEKRAMIIREYLTDNGIDKSRIQIKAWGGKRSLYDKHSAKAKLNVRVEVEVL